MKIFSKKICASADCGSKQLTQNLNIRRTCNIEQREPVPGSLITEYTKNGTNRRRCTFGSKENQVNSTMAIVFFRRYDIRVILTFGRSWENNSYICDNRENRLLAKSADFVLLFQRQRQNNRCRHACKPY